MNPWVWFGDIESVEFFGNRHSAKFPFFFNSFTHIGLSGIGNSFLNLSGKHDNFQACSIYIIPIGARMFKESPMIVTQILTTSDHSHASRSWHILCVGERLQYTPSSHPLLLGGGRRFSLMNLNMYTKMTRNMMGSLPSCHYIMTLGVTVLFSCLIPVVSAPSSSTVLARDFSQSPGVLTSPDSSVRTSRHEDDILAALTIYLEARGESFAGKMAVAAVIRNRMLQRYHSDGTVPGTVLRTYQFEPWIERSPETIQFDPTNPKMQESLLAWNLVQDGRKVVKGAVLFFNPDLVKAPKWALVNRKVAKIGGHEFFGRQRI